MSRQIVRPRILDPLERFSEIVFGLIMVLSFTCAIGIAEAGREDLRTMLLGALCCNVAWGIIDAAFYLVGCFIERKRDAMLLLGVQQSADPAHARQTIAGAVPPKIAEALQYEDIERIRAHLQKLPFSGESTGLTHENWIGALGVFLLVFSSTLPVVMPFVFIHNAPLALRASNAIALALLFGSGRMLASYAGLRRNVTGLVIVGIGAGLVALTIALGG